MRAVVALCVMLSSFLLAASAQAADPIRVLLFQDARQVLLSSERGAVVQLPGGDERLVTTPLVVTPVAGGMTVNGEGLRAEMVRFRGRGDELVITVEEASVSDQQPGQLTDRVSEVGESVFAGSSTGTHPSGVPRAANSMNTLAMGGGLQVIRRGKGFMVINEVDLEEYVKGVVPSEMSSAWHPEALKVQAVAARTYALYQRMMNPGREYDVVAGTQDQVYRGRHGLDDRVQQAVEATRGVVLTHRNAPILAVFSSTAAGLTEDALNVWSKDLPYLKGVECPFDANSPYYRWRAEFKLQDLENGLRREGIAVGAIASVTPFSFSRAGRVARIRILHSDGELILRGVDFRRVVGYTVIPSTQFEIEAVGRTVVLSGRGSGHAVGLCQWGAKELAEMGYSFAAILHYYFPGTELKDARLVELASPSQP